MNTLYQNVTRFLALHDCRHQYAEWYDTDGDAVARGDVDCLNIDADWLHTLDFLQRAIDADFLAQMDGERANDPHATFTDLAGLADDAWTALRAEHGGTPYTADEREAAFAGVYTPKAGHTCIT